MAVAVAGLAGNALAAAEPPLDCVGKMKGADARWWIRLDDAHSVAIVDDRELPAEYNDSHVRIHDAEQGIVFTIGRVSGRMVVMTRDGNRVGAGVCRRDRVI